MRNSINAVNEQLIATKLQELAKNIPSKTLDDIKNIQLNFITKSLLDEKSYLQTQFIDTCLDICSVIRCRFAAEHSQIKLNAQRGFIVIANHFGLNKLTKITVNEISDRIQSDYCSDYKYEDLALTNDDPFIFLFAPVVGLIIQVLKNTDVFISIVSMEYAKPYSGLVMRTGGIVIPKGSSEKYEKIKDKAEHIIESSINKGKITIFIIFPEGGTSGKRNKGSPYSMTEFKNGYARLSFDLNIPVIRFITYFDQFSELNVRSLGTIQCNSNYMVENDYNLMKMELLRYAS